MINTPPIRMPVQVDNAITVPWVTFYNQVYNTINGVDFTYNIGSGPVILSPNGTKWRVAVSNAGVLSAVAV